MRSTPAGSGAVLALDVELDRQPRRVHARDEVGEVRERGLRRERELLVLAAQHAEQAPDLRRALRARSSSTAANARLGAVGSRARELLGRVGVADHRRERLADQVVQLAGDPLALLHHRSGGAGLTVVLERGGLLLQRLVEPDARAHEPAEQHRAADEDRRREQEVVGAARRPVEPDGERTAPTDEHGDARPQPPSLGVRADRVDRGSASRRT